MHRVQLAMVVASGCLSCLADGALAASFEGVGDLPGGDLESRALAVSADGRTVVGVSSSLEEGPYPRARNEAFRWAGGALSGLGHLGGGRASEARGVSADGAVVVGVAEYHERLPGGFSSFQCGTQAFHWTGGTMTALGPKAIAVRGFCSTHHAGLGASADGSLVVGVMSYIDPADPQPARWAPESELLEAQPFYGAAAGVSADGSGIAGHVIVGGAPVAARWIDGALETLGFLPDRPSESHARAISGDGDVIVGESGGVAFRYAGGEMQPLGRLPGGEWSVARGVSADGSVAVGASDSEAGAAAFVWDGRGGLRDLREVLAIHHGVDLAGWKLTEATGISADANTIVGFGTNPSGNTEGWIAVLPSPAAAALQIGVLAVLALLRRRSP